MVTVAGFPEDHHTYVQEIGKRQVLRILLKRRRSFFKELVRISLELTHY